MPFSGAGELVFQRGEGADGAAAASADGAAAVETITISGHWDWAYDGVYYRAEDWGGYPHFEHENGGAHLYHIGCYWQLDDRDQDGTNDYWRGGFHEECDAAWTTNLGYAESVEWTNA